MSCDASRAVCIVVEGIDDSGSSVVEYGSGYRIRAGLVLTALHVAHPRGVRKVTTIRVLTPNDQGFCSGEGRTARRKWPTFDNPWQDSRPLDVALLEIELDAGGAGSGLGPTMFGDARPGSLWDAVGYPIVGHMGNPDRGRAIRQIPLAGRVLAPTSDARTLHLGVDYEPKPVQEWSEGELAPGSVNWSAASGSAVFCGPWLVGVLVRCPQRFPENRLEAVPWSAIRSDPSFPDAYVSIERQKYLTKVMDRVDELVANCASLRDVLQGQGFRLSDPRGRTPASVILGTEIVKLAMHLDSAHLALERRLAEVGDQQAKQTLRGAACALFELATLCLPARVDPNDRRATPAAERAPEGSWDTFRLAGKTALELILASVECRDAAFESTDDSTDPGGRSHVPVGGRGNPGAGHDEELFEELRTNLTRNLGVEPNMEFGPEFLESRINAKARYLREHEGRSRYVYWVGAEVPGFLDRAARRFDAIRFVRVLVENAPPEDAGIVDPIRAMLRRQERIEGGE